jgi:hypothetical protein
MGLSISTKRIITTFTLPGLFVCAAFSTASAGELELRPETLNAWRGYIQSAESGMKARLQSRRPFLWADEDAQRIAALKGGNILAEPVSSREFQGVDHGLIHDWIGAVFIPNVTLEQVRSVIGNYNRYKEYFAPVVVDSRVTGRAGEWETFSMRWVHKVLFITAALDTQYQSRNIRIDDRRCYGIATTTSIQEVENYGRADERKLAPDRGSGYIWRLFSIAKYEQRDGGVFVELQAIALTRDIPLSLRWLVKPIVQRMSRNALVISLRQTRDAVLNAITIANRAPAPGELARAPIRLDRRQRRPLQ